MNDLLKNNIPAVKTLCGIYMVRDLYVFGSILSDKFSDNSDIDFLVSFSDDLPLRDYADNYFDFKEELSKPFGREIDLVTDRSLSNPYFINEVERTKMYIYG